MKKTQRDLLSTKKLMPYNSKEKRFVARFEKFKGRKPFRRKRVGPKADQ